MSPRFEVALIGRPNVGKSTLFNRLVGRRLALVDDQPGVTRDRRSGEARLGHLNFTVVDTAGLMEAPEGSLARRMTLQTEAAIASADLSLFMVDARVGITPADQFFADLLRKSGKPVIVIANKAEGKVGAAGVPEAFALGLGDPIPLSAEHGEGLADLNTAIAEQMVAAASGSPEPEASAAHADDGIFGGLAAERPMKIAVVGRPNTGKSTLINRLIGEERLLTGPEAGITRDAISVDWAWSDRHFRLIDTAGMRRKARILERIEKLSVTDALRTIRFAELVIILIDVTQAFDKQDLQIADLVEREGRAAVIAVNKWDLVADGKARLAELREEAARLLPQFRGIPLVPVSAETGTGLDRLLRAVVDIYEIWNRRIATAELNRWLADALAEHTPPAVSGRRVKLRYITQPKSRPPSFVIFCSRPEALPAAYCRYLTNSLRERFSLKGVPIRLILRRGENPYAKRSRRS